MKTYRFIAIITGNPSIIPNGIKKEIIEITQGQVDVALEDYRNEVEAIKGIIQDHIDEANQQFCKAIILSMDQWESITKEPKKEVIEIIKQQATYKDGIKYLFKALGMEEELGETLDCTDPETGIEFIKQLDNQLVTIIHLATYTNLGDPNCEYYDIKTKDGIILHGISGYHLFPVF